MSLVTFLFTAANNIAFEFPEPPALGRRKKKKKKEEKEKK